MMRFHALFRVGLYQALCPVLHCALTAYSPRMCFAAAQIAPPRAYGGQEATTPISTKRAMPVQRPFRRISPTGHVGHEPWRHHPQTPPTSSRRIR